MQLLSSCYYQVRSFGRYSRANVHAYAREHWPWMGRGWGKRLDRRPVCAVPGGRFKDAVIAPG